jgi:hypothetical protein
MRWVGKLAIMGQKNGTVAIKGYLHFEHVVFLIQIYFRLLSCYSLIYKRCLDEYVMRGQNVPISYNSANRLAHIIYFLNR